MRKLMLEELRVQKKIKENNLVVKVGNIIQLDNYYL